jgi:hypothetical protein
MRNSLIALALVAAGCTPAPGTSNTPESGAPVPSSIVEPYLRIQTELYNDSVENVRANAGNLATASTSLGSPAVKIDLAAIQLAAATELPDAREKFARLSEAIVTYMDGLDLTPPEGVQVARCETTNRQWLQEGSTIANPYDGASAPPCGSFR